jgi:hypothetical protein
MLATRAAAPLFGDLNWGSISDLRTANQWLRLGWVSRKEHAMIGEMLSLSRSVMRGKPISPAALQYILNNHDK